MHPELGYFRTFFATAKDRNKACRGRKTAANNRKPLEDLGRCRDTIRVDMSYLKSEKVPHLPPHLNPYQ